MPSIAFNVAKGAFTDGTLDWDDNNLEVLLLSSATAIDPDLATLTAVLGEGGNTEVTTTNYSRETLANASVTVDNANNRAVLDADDVTWNSIGDGSESAVGAVIFVGTLPVCFVDFTNTVLNGGDFTVQWSANGIITLS